MLGSRWCFLFSLSFPSYSFFTFLSLPFPRLSYSFTFPFKCPLYSNSACSLSCFFPYPLFFLPNLNTLLLSFFLSHFMIMAPLLTIPLSLLSFPSSASLFQYPFPPSAPHFLSFLSHSLFSSLLFSSMSLCLFSSLSLFLSYSLSLPLFCPCLCSLAYPLLHSLHSSPLILCIHPPVLVYPSHCSPVFSSPVNPLYISISVVPIFLAPFFSSS